MNAGLSAGEAAQRLKQYGYNELPSAQPKTVWHIALEVVKEPMFILLLSCGAVYVLLGDYSEGIILLCWVLIIIFITFYQHRKTEQSLEALRQLSSPRALVIRDGTELRIPGREVVPGDIVILHEGDRIPADGVLIESNHLTVDESILTGESVPVLKNEVHETPVFSGTLVVQGTGVARMEHTGARTQFGKIGASLQGIDPGTTRLQQEIKKLVRNLFIAGAIISVGVITAFYLTRGEFLNAVLNGLAAAMALLPEEFPVVLTIFLALGTWRLSKNQVLTRKPAAIETLGSATVLCSDKTGTITQNKMEIAALYNGQTIFHKNEFHAQRASLQELLRVLHGASAVNSIDPMEKAITQEFEQHANATGAQQVLREYPVSKDVPAMTRVLRPAASQTAEAHCKGAPEAVFNLCRLTSDTQRSLLEVVQTLAASGYRVLAAAQATVGAASLPDHQQEFAFTFSGLVAFEDPIRPEVPQAIRECYEAGIRVIMITGDYPATAQSIAQQIGLQHPDRVLTGSELQALSPAVLQERMQTTNVFARIVPEQKLRIIQALKASGEIVAMTGDGVNDAPALKAADIGVAMGQKGTDVAREASSLVLLDDNFTSIVHAVRSGRRIFDNLQKAMSYIIAIHIPIIGLVLLPAFFSWLPILLMPLHIVFLELIIDPVCAIAFESEQEERGIMQRPPRQADERFFGWKKILYSFTKGLLLLGMIISVYFISIHESHSDAEVRVIAFSALIIGNVFLILSSLSDTRSFVAVLREKNIAVLIIGFIALIILFLAITIPALSQVFSFSFPGFQHLYISLIGASALLAVLEVLKWVRRMR
jgi:P-type Ca2+ transporter type 2C